MLKISLLFKENTNFTGDPRLSFKYAPELYFKSEITKNKKHQCMCSEIFFHFRVNKNLFFLISFLFQRVINQSAP